MLNFFILFIYFFFNWQLASKVGIKSPISVKMTCGLLGKVTE